MAPHQRERSLRTCKTKHLPTPLCLSLRQAVGEQQPLRPGGLVGAENLPPEPSSSLVLL